MMIETSHVTIQRLKILGLPVVETSLPEQIHHEHRPLAGDAVEGLPGRTRGCTGVVAGLAQGTSYQ